MNYDLKIFTENIEPEAVNRIYAFVRSPAFAGQRLRIMPDVHCGTGCVVGFTGALGDKIIPNVLGVDLGCGMLVAELGKPDVDLPALDGFIRAYIPCGSAVRKDTQAESLVKKLRCFPQLRALDRLYGSLGTLGGGNHFIEMDKDDDGNFYLVIHSGSRNLGLQVAKIYARLAVDKCKNCAEDARKQVIAEYNKLGRPDLIPDAIAAVNRDYAFRSKIPSEMCYLDGTDMDDYLHDLAICTQFASLNRMRMLEEIADFLKVRRYSSFETMHNYLGEDKILRKGAIAAHKGQRVIIPMNMRDGCFLAVGKGNEDWNESAPHGAGRICKRSEAKELFSVEEFRETMKGVYSSTVNESTLDESPMVYKPAEEIARLIAPTVEIERVIRPVYNFKAGIE